MRHLLISLLVFFLPPCWSGENIPHKTCKNDFSAKLDSIQGKVFFDPESNGHWQQAKLDEVMCEGSRVRVEQYSRASLSLTNGIILRLDEGTVLTLNGLTPDETTLLALLKGFIHFISRTPRRLEISSPIANAGPEGTEFAMRVDGTKAALWVYEGGVRFFNDQGSVRLKPGEGARALVGQAPQTQIDIKPADAVNWALYYPTLLPYSLNSAQIDADIRTAIEDFRQGRVDDALFRLDALPSEKRNTYFYQVRGTIRLTAGQDKLAVQDIQSLQAKNPNDAEALALQSVLSLTQNHKAQALTLAKQAIVADPHSASAYSALSYAEQAHFQLDKALTAAEQAVQYARQDTLVWARKAELELAKGLTADSEATTQQALKLDASLERTQTVRGFSALLRMETDEARQRFERAIQLDSTSPLARLGLGLAKIRQGHLQEGRRDLEIAVILDPNNSLLRSYLGKAYFEENRNALAEDQLSLAKTRDPKDPTPYFYDAIKKQTENRPVEALQDLQQAMTLNDNRAVYRSKQLLDSDRAARGASLARIYDNLGFEQRGIVEATTSLQLDPTNFSAHRFLSDTYVNQSSRETAQLSELLQAKLLQPININPVQPHLAVSQRGLLNASGMASSSFQDFTRNFEGSRPQMIVSGVVGNMGTYSDEVTLSGLLDKFSYSLGQYHYQTDGFTRSYGSTQKERENTEQHHDIYDAFLQWAINDRFSTQFEFVHRETKQGNLVQKLNASNTTFPDQNFLREQIYRAGFNLSIFTDDHLLGSYVHNDSFTYTDQLATKNPGKYTNDDKFSIDFYEGQYLRNKDLYSLVTGFSVYSIKDYNLTNNKLGDANGFNGHREYAYINLKPTARITGTLGLTYDFSDYPAQKLSNVDLYPKIGILWNVGNKIKLRFAHFRENKRPIATVQTIEPTQIAGFNQFYDDLAEKYFWFYGGAIDMAIQPNLFTGVEISRRKVFNLKGGDLYFQKNTSKFYINWSPLDQLAVSIQYNYVEKYSPKSTNVLSTNIVPLDFKYFLPSGFYGKLTGTYINQALDTANQTQVDFNSSNFFLLDASIGFRLPKRLGVLSIEGKNLLNKKFRFEDLSGDENNVFFNPSLFIPERTIFGRITFNF